MALTPEQKGDALIEKYRPHVANHKKWMEDDLCKLCAIICVEEIINSLPAGDFEEMGYDPEEQLKQWDAVLSYLKNK